MRYLTLPLVVLVVIFISCIISWGGFFWSYHSLTHEEPILTLRFEENEGGSYLAHIESPGSLRGEYLIYGDQWRIDAQFVKMKYWANLVGVRARYAIDRLQGRYVDVQDENTLPNVAHQLNGEGGAHFTLFGWNPFFDTEYGSSTYQAIDVSKRFSVYKTSTGIMVRSEGVAPEDREGWLNRLWN